MQNFSEGSVNLEVIRVGGFNFRFLQGWKLDIDLTRSITQTRSGSGYTYFVLVGYIRVLEYISARLGRNKSRRRLTASLSR